MIKYVFAIGTEHQLFQVNAAIEHFRLEPESILLIIFDLANDAYIKKVKSDKSFGSVIIFRNWVFKDLFINRHLCNDFIKFCEEFKKNHPDIIFFSSHYDSDPFLLFLNIVRPKLFYLMDEGTASYSVYYKRLARKNYDLIRLIKSILYKRNIYLPKSLVYFTKYNIKAQKPDTIVNYEVKTIKNPLMRFNSDETIFLGSSIVELKMISEEKYLDLLSKFAKYYQTKLSYFSHRKENPGKLKKLAELGFIVKRNEEPFETWFGKQLECPAIICSFFTTSVLENIAQVYQNIPKLVIYKFDISELVKGRAVYSDIYCDMLKTKRLQFVNL